ncbi:hypothetical protein IWW50_001071 [Coemansia erecta]|nr:hypothetical protein GGF43_004341 [Coemansia sp. RSA 2618]KAJ2829041.1 hypothetical protein IWW50_001071 [Coemansia erecta]
MSAINSIFSSHDASNSSPLKEPHDQELCKDTFCEHCIEKDNSDEDSDSDEDYRPGTQIKLVVFHHAVSANDFLAIPYSSIPVFSGNPHEITCAYLDLVESEWTEYSQLQAHWVAKLRGSYLAGEALKVANDFVGYDWLKFREHMERWFSSANARMHMRYMMVDSHSYLVDMDLRQAISRARQDYIAQGD